MPYRNIKGQDDLDYAHPHDARNPRFIRTRIFITVGLALSSIVALTQLVQ